MSREWMEPGPGTGKQKILTSFLRSAAVAADGTRIATRGVEGDDVRERWIVISSAILFLLDSLPVFVPIPSSSVASSKLRAGRFVVWFAQGRITHRRSLMASFLF